MHHAGDFGRQSRAPRREASRTEFSIETDLTIRKPDVRKLYRRMRDGAGFCLSLLKQFERHEYLIPFSVPMY
jgi:hypothetical protein